MKNSRNDQALKIFFLEDELKNQDQKAQKGDSQDAVSSDPFSGIDHSAKDNGSVGSSSEVVVQFVDATKAFFAWARQELQGGSDESTTHFSLVDDVALSTDQAQNEIDKAGRVVLEISARVCKQVGEKFSETFGEFTGLDAAFLAKMAKKYEESQKTLVDGGSRKGLISRFRRPLQKKDKPKQQAA